MASDIFDAARRGDVPRLKAIVDAGGNINQKGLYDWTALHYAAVYGRVTAMALLLDLGGDVSATDRDGRTALHWAAYNGHVDTVALLLDRGADLSITDSVNETARDLAVRRNEEDVVQEIDYFVRNMSGEWRPQRHTLYPLPFRSAVATVVALWGWNPTAEAPWHPESPFSLLSLELLFEVFIWLSAAIAELGYVVAAPDKGGHTAHKGGKVERMDVGGVE